MNVNDTVIVRTANGDARATITRIDDGDYYLRYIPPRITDELYPFGEEDLIPVEPDYYI